MCMRFECEMQQAIYRTRALTFISEWKWSLLNTMPVILIIGFEHKFSEMHFEFHTTTTDTLCIRDQIGYASYAYSVIQIMIICIIHVVGGLAV